MSLPVSKAKSDAARAEGNTAFKKGRWTESIGCYTTAILHNQDDPLAYGNRAQAYLKLDKFADAERDCTTALAKQGGNVKALYRRALARKGLEKYDEALLDLQELLKTEVGNAAALEEVEEIEKLRKSLQAAQDARPKRPPSPPTLSTRHLPPVQSTAPTGAAEKQPSPAPETSAKSFTSLKSARAGKKAAFVPPISPPATPTVAIPAARLGGPGPSSSPPAAAQESVPAAMPPPAPKQPQVLRTSKPETTPASPPPQKAPTPPTDPQSTAAGTGILLLRALNPLTPPSGWALLRQYPPTNIPIILGPILEPDSLGVILLALAAGSKAEGESDKEKVQVILEGLKQTPRFSMNTMMLEPRAAEAGNAAWKDAGGEGQWP